MKYEELTSRNGGYVQPKLQERIRKTRLLIAGCGIGSMVAEAAVRIGFEQLILVDGDDVAPHNLNRQAFTSRDIDRPKVSALAERLRAIHPGATVVQHTTWVNEENAPSLVNDADVVLDTIDFLSLSGIVALHDAAQRAAKPIVSALSVGWGGAVIYFDPKRPCSFRELFGIPAGPVADASYTERFSHVIERLAPALDPEVIEVVSQALRIMEDGRPCPAAQVSPGAAMVASLAVTLLVSTLRGEMVTAAPEMVVVNPSAALRSRGIALR